MICEDERPRMMLPIVITHPDRQTPLLVRGPRGCVLPRVATPDGWLPEVIDEVSRAVTTALKRDAIGLRFLLLDAAVVVCEAEVLDRSRALPAPFFWTAGAGKEHLAALDIPNGDRRLLELWFAEVAQAPDMRAPWERPGWHARAVRWIDAQVAAGGATRTGGVTQIKGGWSESSVLRVPTTGGALFFKAGVTAEVETQVLMDGGDGTGSRLPQVAAVDREEGWLLLRDFGGRELDCLSTRECIDAVTGFARLQIDLARRCAPDALGAPDDPVLLDCRPSRLRDLYLDAIAPLPATHQRLEHALDGERLRAAADRIMPIAAALDRDGVPLALVNRDFTPANVHVSSSGFIYFDWADVVRSHPFFSAIQFFQHLSLERERRIGAVDAASLNRDLERISRAYLDMWRGFAPFPVLEDSLRHAGELHALFLAIRWAAVLRRTHPASFWAGQVAFGRRECLAKVAASMSARD